MTNTRTGLEAAIKVATCSISGVLEDLPEDAPAKDIITAAMVACRQHQHAWLLKTEDEQFRSAISAIYIAFKEREMTEAMERLEYEVRLIKECNEAIAAGKAINIERAADVEVFGLMGYFHEALKS